MRRKSFYAKVVLTFSVIVAATGVGAGIGFMRILRLTITDYEIRYSKRITTELSRNLGTTIGQVQGMIGEVVRRLSDDDSSFRHVLTNPRASSVRSNRAGLLAFDTFFHGKLTDIPAVRAITIYATAPNEFSTYEADPDVQVDTSTLASTREFQLVQSQPDYFKLVGRRTPSQTGEAVLLTSLVDADLEHYGVLAVHIDVPRALVLAGTSDRVGRIVVTDDRDNIYFVTPDPGETDFRELRQTIATIDGSLHRETSEYVIVSARTDSRLLNVINLIPTPEIYAEVRTVRRAAAVLVLALLGISVVVVFYVSGHIASRVHRIGVGMQRLQAGTWGVQIPEGQDTGELSRLEQSFNEMSRVLERLIHRDYISQVNLKEAQLVALQSQIRPHFLFNTLESIRLRLVRGGHHDAARPLLLLSELFSAVVRHKSLFVPLEQELNYCESFLELHAVRHPDRLRFAIEVPETLYETYVPKLILQPVVENAVKHGLDRSEQSMSIALRAKCDDGKVEIEISDDGPGMSRPTLAEVRRNVDRSDLRANTIGLSNVQHRVRTLFGSRYGLRVESQPGRGTRVCVVIPVIRRDEADSYVHGHNR